jgi:hypothetical protein
MSELGDAIATFAVWLGAPLAEFPILHVRTIKQYGVVGESPTTSITTAPMATTTGDTVFLIAINYATAAFGSVEDNQAHTWTQITGSPVQVDARTQSLRMFHTNITTEDSAATFTLNITGGANDWCTLFAMEFSGVKVTSPLDVTAKQSQAALSQVTSGITATRANANELLIGAWAGSGLLNTTALNAGVGWTIPTNGTQESRDGGGVGAVAYKIVSAIGTDAVVFDLDQADDGGTMIATFKAEPTS